MTQCENPVYTDMGYGQGARWGWQTSASYPSISFAAYKQITNVADAVKYWFYDFEWHYSEIPDWVNFPARVAWGEYAYQIMEGQTPEPPGPGPGPGPAGSSKKFWMFLKPHWKRWTNGN